MPTSATGTAAGLAAYVSDWHPGPVVDDDDLSPAPTAALSAALGLDEPAAAAGQALPPLWHWLHFLTWPPQSALGPDGHPTIGHFLPPLPNRTRMFAGGRCSVSEPLHIGERTQRTSTLVSVKAKQGRTGALMFVTHRSEYRQRHKLCLVEETDIVYRSGESDHRFQTSPGEAEPRLEAPWTLPLSTDATLLFRVSALTANTHRIHYDQPYATAIEGYPGLVVHGPLLALAMLELPRRYEPSRPVRFLSYRMHTPAFAGEPLCALGTPSPDGAELAVASARSQHATAQVVLA